MKIIKSSFFKPKKCDYGKFELQPDEGWKISDTFIDFESKLLIVSTSVLDKNQWIDNKYNYTIPTKEYKIDLETLEILDFERWKKFFNYERQEILSSDGTLKLIHQRSYEEERDSDGIKEDLYEIATNKVIASSDSIAFCERKRQNLLEDHYLRIKEFEDYKKRLDEKLTLEQFYQKYLEQVEPKKAILSYYNAQKTFKLEFDNNQFVLHEANEIPNFEYQKFNFVKTFSFNKLDDFWLHLTSNENWYKEFSIYMELTKQPFVVSKFIYESFNKIRQSQNFTYSEYDKISNWQRAFWSEEFKPSEIKQWCSNCGDATYYMGRYPKAICSKCYAKDKFSKDGALLEFYNLSLSGGLKIVYKNQEGTILKEDDTQIECLCIIDNKKFIAQEAKFGGIIIQKKE